MTSVVLICNQAIGRIRADTIGALTDPTVQAKACTTFYEASRDFVLADFPWNFAGKTMVLAKKSETPEEWQFCYAYPSDALKVRYLYAEGFIRSQSDLLFSEERFRTSDGTIPYDVGLSADNSKAIFSNHDLARCKYTVKLENVNQFDAHFVTALSWYLASEIAIPIAGTSKGRVLADRSALGYQNVIAAAYSATANESDPGLPRDSEMIRAHQ